jgi:upstream activation factor subunit UAF30
MSKLSKSKISEVVVVDNSLLNTPVVQVAQQAKRKKPVAKETLSSTAQTTTAPTPQTTTAIPTLTTAPTLTPQTATTPTLTPQTAVQTTTATLEHSTEEHVGDGSDILAQSTEFLSKLNQMSSMIALLKTEYRTLEKKWSRELKAAQKTSAKRKRKSGNRAPSGFVKPTRISDELATFLDKPSGTEMARTDVTREINKYIRSNNLQDKDNGRKINPDSKLQSLLKLNTTDELTYFNLQRYMSPHFFKAIKEVVGAV